MTDWQPISTVPATRVLQETARRRADLYLTLIALEQAAARPIAGREEDWAAGVTDALRDLEREIEQHIEITEGRDGLYEEIASIAPRLSHRVGRLRDDHVDMLAETRALRFRLESTPIGNRLPVAEVRDALQLLLGHIVKHRQQGSDLVWEAYNLDIGGVE